MKRSILLAIVFLGLSSTLNAEPSQPMSQAPKSLAAYKEIACEKYLLADRLSAQLSYNELVSILATLEPEKNKVLLLRGGRGEFALQNSNSGSIRRHTLAIPVYHPHFFYQLDRQHNLATPISADEFSKALNWRNRPKQTMTSTQRWAQAARRIWVDDRYSIDPVHAQVLRQNYLMQMVWRYTVNSLSDESYQLLRWLVANKKMTLDHILVAVDSEPVPTNVRRLTQRIWQQAKEMGYKPKLIEDEYAPTELEEILAQYGIKR